MLLGTGIRYLQLTAIFLAGLLLLAPAPLLAQVALLQKADKQITAKKFKAAVRTITKAMNAGDLTDPQMAQALYKRGIAYNGTKRHSAAIADLTGAIWLGKLDGAAQKLAYQQRAIAYKSTGHNKQARSDFAKSGARAVAAVQGPARQPAIVVAAPPIPAFNTVVRSEKKKTAAAQTKIAAKPQIEKKAVIPAFRTTIVAE